MAQIRFKIRTTTTTKKASWIFTGSSCWWGCLMSRKMALLQSSNWGEGKLNIILIFFEPKPVLQLLKHFLPSWMRPVYSASFARHFRMYHFSGWRIEFTLFLWGDHQYCGVPPPLSIKYFSYASWSGKARLWGVTSWQSSTWLSWRTGSWAAWLPVAEMVAWFCF